MAAGSARIGLVFDKVLESVIYLIYSSLCLMRVKLLMQAVPRARNPKPGRAVVGFAAKSLPARQLFHKGWPAFNIDVSRARDHSGRARALKLFRREYIVREGLGFHAEVALELRAFAGVLRSTPAIKRSGANRELFFDIVSIIPKTLIAVNI